MDRLEPAPRALWVASLLAIAVGCSRPGHGAVVAAGPAESDTIVGTVHVARTDPTAPIDLMPSSPAGEEAGGLPVKLIRSPALLSVDGLRVQVVGTQASDRRWPGRLAVLQFTVIGSHGQQAIDGILTEDGGALSIMTADGVRHALTNPPPELRAHVGERVWVAGPLNREPATYGVIASTH